MAQPLPFRQEPTDCPDCGARPGEAHYDGCDVERCSVCGLQRMGCSCYGHDPLFSRWTGWWPGELEAAALGLDLNAASKYDMHIYKKPKLPSVESHPPAKDETVYEGEYISIIFAGNSRTGKTRNYRIVAKEGLIDIGTVNWMASWRQYAFFPGRDTLFHPGCMDEISLFIKGLMAERKLACKEGSP